MPTVILVRHGQASFGSSNYDMLSPVGHQQAELVGAFLRIRAEPNVVITGTLSRQQDTAKTLIAAAGFDARQVVDPGWDEYDHLGLLRTYAGRLGTLRTGLSAAAGGGQAVQKALDSALHAWVTSGDPAPNGLTWKEFQGDAVDSLDLALAGEQALVVTSGGVIAAVCTHLLGLGADGFVKLNRVGVNTGITTVVRGRSGTSLLSFNEHAHLAGPARKDLLTYR